MNIFVGNLCPLPPENRPTGMFKVPVPGVVRVTREGLAGDQQADRRVHGGMEKALHQYAVASYGVLAGLFPEAASLLVPGSMGENLSEPGWDEANVAIGDIFRLGSALIQVCQPRTPCWKIDHRFSSEGMAQKIGDLCIPGWYFRVLEEGDVTAGEGFERTERNPEPVSVAALLALWAQHRPAPEALEQAASTRGLAENWARKLRERADWLRIAGS